jgi:hypothetical protein
VLAGGLHLGGISMSTSSASYQGNTYNGDATLRTSAALLDFHPFGGAFFLSAGLFRVNASLNQTGSPSTASDAAFAPPLQNGTNQCKIALW